MSWHDPGPKEIGIAILMLCGALFVAAYKLIRYVFL